MIEGLFHRLYAAGACIHAETLFRNVPANTHELRLALIGLPQDMKVLAESETGVSENIVEWLCARTTWPPDFSTRQSVVR
jgi:hypothetical protein